MRQLQPPPNAEASACPPHRPHVFANDLLPTAAATAAGPRLYISLSTLGRPMIKLVTHWGSLQGILAPAPDPDSNQWRQMQSKMPPSPRIWKMTSTSLPLEELPLKQILTDPSFAAGGSTGKKCPSSLASSSGGPAAIDAGRPAALASARGSDLGS